MQVSGQGAVDPGTGEYVGAGDEVYAEFLAEHVPGGALPARTTVFVDLPHEVMLVEIDALAVTD